MNSVSRSRAATKASGNGELAIDLATGRVTEPTADDSAAQPDQGERGPDDADVQPLAEGAHDASKPAKRRKSQAAELVELASGATLFHTATKEPYGTFGVGRHRETWPITGKVFRHWLAGAYYKRHKRPPGAQALHDAMTVLQGKAIYDSPMLSVYTRLAQQGGAVYLDLADADWRAVKVDARAWSIVTDPPLKFRRSRGMLPLPVPVRGGSLAELRASLNVGDKVGWRLLMAWLLAALRPVGPYPVLVLHGEQGAGKSTVARVLRALVDPSAAPLRSEPKDARDLIIAATNSWVMAYDNLSYLPAWLSDCFCRLSTGGGFSTRELYTDADEMLFDAQRPVILTGIEELATRGDLIDRSLILQLPAISSRHCRAEADFLAAFERARPRILGALLDAVAGALRDLPTVKLDRLPRMADFAVWATAAEKALGWKDGAFLRAYTNNRKDANELALEASPIVPPLRALIEHAAWQGTCTQLLERLASAVSDKLVASRQWPKTARALSGTLRRLAPNLRRVGVLLQLCRQPGGKRERTITIKKTSRILRPNRPDGPEPPQKQPETAGSFAPRRDANSAGQEGVASQQEQFASRSALEGTEWDGRDAKSRHFSNEKWGEA